MKLGKIYISHKYIVDLEDQNMIEQAKIAMYEDLMNAVKYDELHLWINIDQDDTAEEQDIPEFLIEEDND